MKKIASFDIFDTTLIRKCGRQENIFYLLARKLFPNDELRQVDFYMWRLHAERIAIKRIGKRNLTLSDIYTCINDFGEDLIDANSIIQAEKNIEFEQLVSNFEIKKIIEDKRSEGYIICFISDMYLESTFLQSVLIREGCAQENDMIFVSCEHDKRKDTGELFQFVKVKFGEVDEWIHYGDNFISDYKNAKKNCSKATLVNTDFSESEKLMEKKYLSHPYGRDWSILIGFQRCARLHLAEKDVDYANGADFVASALIPYLLYIVNIAKKKGYKKLFFLSRDAYVLYKTAQSCIFFDNIDCQYLFLSRRSLALPLLSELTKERLTLLLGDQIFGSYVMDILKLFQISDLSLKFPFDRILSDEDLDFFVSTLKSKQESIMKRQSESKALLDLYFLQEGIYDSDSNFAIIDVGWLGTTRLMINELRKERGLKKIPFIYYGCRVDVFDRQYGEFFSYLPCEFIDHDKTVIVESYYCASKYPSTIGYIVDNGHLKPKLEGTQAINMRLAAIHTEVCREIIDYIEQVGLQDTTALLGWVGFIEIFSTHPHFIDYSSLRELRTTDNGYIIERISLYRLLKYLIRGYINSDCLAVNSVYDTYGFIVRNKWIIKNIMKRISQFLKR